MVQDVITARQKRDRALEERANKKRLGFKAENEKYNRQEKAREETSMEQSQAVKARSSPPVTGYLFIPNDMLSFT